MDPGSSLRSPGATEKINLPFTIPSTSARKLIPALSRLPYTRRRRFP